MVAQSSVCDESWQRAAPRTQSGKHMKLMGFAIDGQVLPACRFTRHHHRREPIMVSMRAVNEEQQISEG